jgi:hypothetical protein
MKQNKYNYYLVIQQNYRQGWEDNSQYFTNSQGIPQEMSGKFREGKNGIQIPISLFKADLSEYVKTGYCTRSIFRKELKN